MSLVSKPFSSCDREVSTSHGLSAIALFMWLLPYFAIPTVAVFRPPAASLFLFLWACFALTRPQIVRLRISPPGSSRGWVALFFIYCLISAAYGYWNLESMGKLTLELTTGNIEYVQVVMDRLLQLILVLVAFEVVRHSRHSSRQIMRWWLQGLTGAVLLHILTYGITSDTLMQRAGTFNEGNLAGLYYLLSIFVALEYRRVAASSSSANRFLFAAILGVFLSRSTAGIVLVTILLSFQYALSATTRRRLLARSLTLIVLLPSIAVSIAATGLDFGIREKLFEEDVTAQSFSRIDRLESISAAVDLFTENPLLGHGLQTYGFLSNELLTGPLQATYDGSYRRIPNNIYAELAAELGLVGLIFYLGFIASLIRLAVKRTGIGRIHWLLGLTGVLLYWNAFPTYSVIFIWVFFGLIMKSVQSRKPAPTPTGA